MQKPGLRYFAKSKHAIFAIIRFFLKEIDGKFFLFSYFEYVGRDFKLDMQKMASDPETQRWWKETDPCQQPLPDAQEKGEIWSAMTELFHLD